MTISYFYKIMVLFILCSLISMNFTEAAIIINHTCTNVSSVPTYWINQAKARFRIWYGHTSHGSQITSGMEVLYNSLGSLYAYGWDPAAGVLSYQEEYGDLGSYGDLYWESMTRDRLNQSGNDRNVVIWSWCGGVSDNTVEGINIYLNAMNQLELDYPNVKFVYMTGHLDGSGVSGNLHQRNNQIRNYCNANNKTLFDFADIESYNPDGAYFLNLGADDGCYYNGGSGNWATEWCDANPASQLCLWCDCAHSQPLNCNLKGRAFWWMMARMAGWTGPGGPTPTPNYLPAANSVGISLLVLLLSAVILIAHRR